MKIISVVILLFSAMALHAQNEFANPGFYSAFRKIKADGANGFAQSKGAPLRSLGVFFTLHQSKLNITGTDSGRVSIPVSVGSPSAHFYFKPLASKEAVQKKESNLLAAVKTAWGAPLVEKKITDTIGSLIYYRTRLYNKPPANRFTNPDVETYITKDKNNYLLVLQLQGVNTVPAASSKTNVPAETDLNKRITELLLSMDNNFDGEKVKLINTTQYYTEYESQYRLYGKPATVKFRPFETSFRWTLGQQQPESPEEAKRVFEQLKATFGASGRFAFKTETREGSRTWLYASELGQKGAYPQFNLVLEYYDAPNNFSVAFLLTKRR
jgi:hypothetical protein